MIFLIVSHSKTIIYGIYILENKKAIRIYLFSEVKTLLRGTNGTDNNPSVMEGVKISRITVRVLGKRSISLRWV